MGQKVKIPKGAFVLETEGKAEFVAQEGGAPKLNMVVYSGGVIKDHWYWGNLILDLPGFNFPKKKYPILQDHWTDAKIGFHKGKPIVDTNLRFDPDRVVFVSTPASEEFRTCAAEGFPYEASARVRPTAIERLTKDAVAEANGIKLKGPGTIFRKMDFIEGSVCTFGYDRNTESSVFADKTEMEIFCDWEEIGGEEKFHQETITVKENIKETSIMDLDELKLKHPDLVKAIQKEAVADTESKFNAEKQEIMGEVAKLSETVNAQGKQLKEQDEKLNSFEKDKVLQTELSWKREAKQIWTEKLDDSTVPLRLHKKAMNQVKYSKFVKDDQFDAQAFAEAVDKEIEDWEQDDNDEVLGFSSSGKADDSKSAKLKKEHEEDDAFVDEMLALAQGDEDEE
jgi:hypothetical protein